MIGCKDGMARNTTDALRLFMEKVDPQLERSLDELNERVNALEESGDRKELLETLVDRAGILDLMGYRTSAVDDLETAAALSEDSGISGVDEGTLAKIYFLMASAVAGQGGDPIEQYDEAARHLNGLRSNSPRFDRRESVGMCLTAAADLIDYGHPEEAEPFIRKGLQLTEATDTWSANRRLEMLNTAVDAYESMGGGDTIGTCSEAIEIGASLMERGALDDVEQLVSALAMRAAAESDKGLDQNAAMDLEAAVGILEGMLENHTLRDTGPLMDLHRDLAGSLMRLGRVEEAEKHLIRSMHIEIGSGASSDLRGQQI